MEETVKVYKVTRPDAHGHSEICVYRTWAHVEQEFDGAEYGDKISVELNEMTVTELEALGDFAGW